MRTDLDIAKSRLTRKARFFWNTRLQLDLILGRLLLLGAQSAHRPADPDGTESAFSMVWRAIRQWLFDIQNDHRRYLDKSIELGYAHRQRAKSAAQSRLPDHELAALIIRSSSAEYITRVGPKDLIIDNSIFEERDENLYFKQKGTRFLCEILDGVQHEITTVLNVGARIDSTFFYAARRYPDLKFVSLDFQTNLRLQNKEAFHGRELPPNWRFLSGYGLDMLSAGLRADLAFFMATSMLFGGPEFRSYLRALASSAKYLVFSESWFPRMWPFALGKISKPEQIDPERMELAGPSNIQRNYIHELSQAGFEVQRSRLLSDHHNGTYLVLNVAAKNKRG